MNEEQVAKAFTIATLEASQILRFAVSHPEAIAKSQGTTDEVEAVAYLAKALARNVARIAIGKDLEDAENERAQRLGRFEARQAFLAAEHAMCSEVPCEDCKIAKDEDEQYAKAMSNRPHLDSARAEAEGDGPPAVPWFDPDPNGEDDDGIEKTGWTDEARAAALETRRRNQGKWMPTPAAPASRTPWLPTPSAPPSKTPWRETPTFKAALDLGFEPGDTDTEYVHRDAHHVVKFEADGFLIASGWDHRTILRGTTPDDLVEAMAVLDE